MPSHTWCFIDEYRWDDVSALAAIADKSLWIVSRQQWRYEESAQRSAAWREPSHRFLHQWTRAKILSSRVISVHWVRLEMSLVKRLALLSSHHRLRDEKSTTRGGESCLWNSIYFPRNAFSGRSNVQFSKSRETPAIPYIDRSVVFSILFDLIIFKEAISVGRCYSLSDSGAMLQSFSSIIVMKMVGCSGKSSFFLRPANLKQRGCKLLSH